MNLSEMTPAQAEQHLKEGGTFEAAGGALRVHHFAPANRYVLSNDTGNGADYIQPRLTTVMDLAEQLTGSLAAWEAAGGGK